MAYRNYGPNAGLIVNPNGQGDFTTVGAALAAATSGKTIYLYPGTYVENITLKAGVNIVAWDADAPSKNVTIKGTCSYSAAGNVFISGICLETNGSYALSVTGILTSSVTLTECYLNCTDFTGINFTSSSASSVIDLSSCRGNLATTGIAYFTSSSPGVLNISYCFLINNGVSLTASTITSSTSLFLLYTVFSSSINTNYAATLLNSLVGYGVTNTTAYIANSSGRTTATNCYFDGGTQPAISIGSEMSISNSTILSSNVNAITGTGLLLYYGLSFIGSSSNINTSTTTQLPSGLPLNVTNGGTGLASTTINQLLYSSATNTISGLATGNNGVLITSATGVPSLIANGTTGQVLTATTGAPVSWTTPTSGTVTSVSGTAGQITVVNGTTTPVISIAATYVGQTSITTLGTISSGVWNGTAVTVPYGGTGLTSTTAYSLICGGTTTTSSLQSLASVAAGQILTSNGVSALPAYSATLPSTVQSNITSVGTITSGVWNGTVVTVPYGGTGAATLTGVLTGNGTSAVTASAVTQYATLLGGSANSIVSLPAVATGSVLVSGGVSANPSFSATPKVTSITFGSGNALNSYIEGTFLPTIQGQVIGGTTVYSVQRGIYTRVGRMVTVYFEVSITSATGTGVMFIGNMPYAPLTSTGHSPLGAVFISVVSAPFVFPTNSSQLNLQLIQGNTNCLIRGSGPLVTTDSYLFMANGAIYIYGQITYSV